jgi:hypothetical protein
MRFSSLNLSIARWSALFDFSCARSFISVSVHSLNTFCVNGSSSVNCFFVSTISPIIWLICTKNLVTYKCHVLYSRLGISENHNSFTKRTFTFSSPLNFSSNRDRSTKPRWEKNPIDFVFQLQMSAIMYCSCLLTAHCATS